MAAASEDILVIQLGTSQAETHKGVSEERAISLVAERAPHVADRLRAGIERLAAIRNEVITDPDKVVEYYSLQIAQAQTDIVVNRDLEQFKHEQQVDKVETFHRYTSIGSCLLYDSPGFTGASKFIAATFPNLGWWPYNFDNRATSAVAWGGNILFQNTWYGGRRLYLIGFPVFRSTNLATPFAFDNIASSYLSF